MKLLENKQIMLRAVEPEDLEYFYRWENDSTLWSLGCTLAPYSRYELKEYIEQSSHDLFVHKQLRFMIEHKLDAAPIGTIDLYEFDPLHRRVGVGILIDEAYRKHGYAAQALTMIQAYIFDFLDLHQLFAHIVSNNEVSLHLFDACGYTHTSTLKDWIKIGAKYNDVYVYQLFND